MAEKRKRRKCGRCGRIRIPRLYLNSADQDGSTRVAFCEDCAAVIGMQAFMSFGLFLMKLFREGAEAAELAKRPQVVQRAIAERREYEQMLRDTFTDPFEQAMRSSGYADT